MSLAATWIRLGGTTPATEVAPHSPPTWETLASGGNGEATFELGRSAKFESHLTRPGLPLEIFVGAMRVWFGRIGDFDRETGQVVGRGVHTNGQNIPALVDGNATRNLEAAFAYAAASGWDWPVRLNGNAVNGLGDSGEPLMIWPLIELIAEQNGQRAVVDPDGKLFLAADPTAPTWTITPEAAAFGQTNEDQSTVLIGRYSTGVGPNLTTIRPNPLPANPRSELIDLTGEGTLTGAQADAILDAMLAGRSQTGWVNGVTLHREQITRNGTPAFLPEVHARNRMVRAQGMATAFGAMHATWVDAVLGKTKYTAGSDVIYLEPVNKAPRTLTEVTAAL